MGFLRARPRGAVTSMRLILLLLPLSLACKPSSTATTTTTTTTATTTRNTGTTAIATDSTAGHLQTRPAETETTTTPGTTTTGTTTAGTASADTTTADTTTADTTTADTTTAGTTPGDTTTAPIDCPEGWIDATEDGLGCLYFVGMDDGINWLATQTICQTNNGYSVEALDMTEAGKLFDLALLTSYFSYRETWWLGLTDLAREGTWTWSNSYSVDVNTSVYSEIWTPNTDVGNADDCVVMTVGNDSHLAWKDIPCLDVEFDSKPIQAVCQCKGSDCPRLTPTMPTVATAPTPHECPEGWVAAGVLGCVFPLTDQPALSSQEAQAACQEIGGYLVEPLSANKETDLEGVAEILYNIVAPWSWWLGLSLQESESGVEQWLWGSDNSTLDTNTTYWADGEGTGANGKTCALLGKGSIEWQWHEVACDAIEYRGESIGAICQECLGEDCPTPAGTSTTTTTTTTMTTTAAATTNLPKPDDCISNNSTADTSCYFLNTTKLTWIEAEQSCMSYGGHLASLLSDDENIFLGLNVVDGNDVWLGGFSRTIDDWAWSDDTEWSYAQWKTGEATHEGYVYFEARTYKWMAASAPNEFSFVCKIP